MKHDLETAKLVLKNKNLDYFLDIKKIDHSELLITLIDKDYGEYICDIKALCPQAIVPLHKKRKFKLRIDKIKTEHINTKINGFMILDVFYGPDRGYKNRSFYMEYIGECGHISIGTRAYILKHKKNLGCPSCSHSVHGERIKIDGIRKKRTPTYSYWVQNNKKFPKEYQNFEQFKKTAGDKPSKKCKIEFIDNKPVWFRLDIEEDNEINLIAIAIRQAFRHSKIYKNVINLSQVETEQGTRYSCFICKKLFKRKEIQVDHIDPIAKLDGTPLKKEELIERIWTDKIQVIDKKCHSKKSSQENKLRKLNKLNLLKNNS